MPYWLNFLEVESLEEAKLVWPKVTILTRPTKPKIDNVTKESDAKMMVGFTRDRPEYVYYKGELYWKRDAEKKRKVKNNDEAGHSWQVVVNIESSEIDIDWDKLER
ncbi:uncharacterized protein [Aegilops tauschii subsp. strangulata]|uniref:uncharacterized protein n=1 Tax=Aegilops tauschii subsp. strangulata TaxID=200361 RepID=UPI003CC8E007